MNSAKSACEKFKRNLFKLCILQYLNSKANLILKNVEFAATYYAPNAYRATMQYIFFSV